jgi:2-polyprenyl-6-methoxyphenol hydroxylase-like FAD-dependent oxidoreductase
VVLTLMVAGIVALTALLDQRTFQITALQQQVSSFQSRDRVLTEQAAALDAPGRIGIWARRHGLAAPPQGAVVILDVPGQGPASGGRP